jgi:starch-binding outer membrane protein, SusD/RagB family
MMRSFYRARLVTGCAVLVAAVGCSDVKDQLLSPQQPSVIGPGDLTSPTAADALRIGALGRLRTATAGGENTWILGGLITDEWKSGDTFSQRNDTDQRKLTTDNGNVNGWYVDLHRTRGAAKDAIDALTKYLPEPKANIAQMYFAMGLAEVMISESFCNGTPFGYTQDGVPNYSQPMTNEEGFKLALAHIDSGLAFATASDTSAVALATRPALLITKARIMIQLGRFSEVAALTSSIPTTYRWNATFAQTSGDNSVWSFNTSQKRWVVGDSFDITGTIKNALPFASARDPRVPVTGTSINSSEKLAFDNQTNFVYQRIYSRSDAAPIVSGLDARLYEAEARLQANDIPGMMTILNALRTQAIALSGSLTIAANTLPALATPANTTAAQDLYFRDKAFWLFSRGQRLGDLRRLIRQYKRTQDNVFPTGPFWKGATYGTDVNFPVTTSENYNPNYHGCIDRNA